jgi:predicted RNase H-like HicB family nuclease
MSTKHEVRRKITLTEDEETGLWSAVDEDEGVASQGETRHEALENLDEAVALTQEVREEMDDAPEPSVPWFDDE